MNLLIGTETFTETKNVDDHAFYTNDILHVTQSIDTTYSIQSKTSDQVFVIQVFPS